MFIYWSNKQLLSTYYVQAPLQWLELKIQIKLSPCPQDSYSLLRKSFVKIKYVFRCNVVDVVVSGLLKVVGEEWMKHMTSSPF